MTSKNQKSPRTGYENAENDKPKSFGPDNLPNKASRWAWLLFAWGCVIIFYIIFLNTGKPVVLDDVYPGAPCEGMINDSDIIFVIPVYGGLAQNSTWLVFNEDWCNETRLLNKTFGIHGIEHTLDEFGSPIIEDDLWFAIQSFERCFGVIPKYFRPPYNNITVENVKLLQKYELKVYNEPYYKHPYCHCAPNSTWLKILNGVMQC